MAEVVRYVDPDAGGGATGVDWANAYTSMNAWEGAEQTDLPTDGDNHVVYFRSSGGTADTASVSVNGWTTDATHDIRMEAASGDEAVKSGYDATRYRLEVNGDALALSISYITIIGLQIHPTSAGGRNILTFVGIVGITVDSCYLNASDVGVGIQLAHVDAEFDVYNTIIYSPTGPSAGSEGIHLDDCNVCNIWNCLVSGFDDGIERDTGTVTVTNCAVFNNNPSDFDGTMTIDHCASDDGTGTNAVAASGGDWDNEYNDPSNGDFTLLNGGNCYHGGADNPSSGIYTVDIEDDAYNSGAYSIGVDEYVTTGTNPKGPLGHPLFGALGGPI